MSVGKPPVTIHEADPADTEAALTEAGALYRKTGWIEIPRFNDDPYIQNCFEKRL